MLIIVYVYVLQAINCVLVTTYHCVVSHELSFSPLCKQGLRHNNTTTLSCLLGIKPNKNTLRLPHT